MPHRAPATNSRSGLQASTDFSEAVRLYAFTSENLCGYFGPHTSPSKQVLTVAGSGDHALNAAFFGARKVTLFDVSPYSLAWAYLKIAAVKHLSFSAFKSFFFKDSRSALELETYKKLSAYLAKEHVQLLDSLYSQSNNQGYTLRHSSAFRSIHDKTELALTCNPYLKSEASYNTLQQVLNHCSFTYYCSSAAEIGTTLKGSNFSAIYLSNLADYAHKYYQGSSPLTQFAEKEVAPLLSLLEPCGTLYAAYAYKAEQYPLAPRCEVDQPAERRSAFEALGATYKEQSFTSIISGYQDLVVTLTQIKEDS